MSRYNVRRKTRTKISDYSDCFQAWKSIARQAIVEAVRQWVLPAGTVNLEPHNATVNRYCEEFIISTTDERVGLRGQLGIRAKTTILPFTPLGLYIGHYLCEGAEAEEHDATYGSAHTESYYFGCDGQELVISGFPEGNKLSLFNSNTTHGFFPGTNKPKNVVPVQVLHQGWPYVMFVSGEQVINQHTELLLDYGYHYWKAKVAPIVVSDSDSDDELIMPRSPSLIQPALSPDTTRPPNPTTVNVPQRLPTPPSATPPLPLAAPQPFSAYQPYPTHQPELLIAAAQDTGLRLIDMPPYGNNCLLFAILFSVQAAMPPIYQSWINQAANLSGATPPPFLLSLFNQFRADIAVGQHAMLGKDHGEHFIQWLMQRGLLSQAGYNLVEFHSVVFGGQSYCIRDGHFIPGQYNIALWNCGNHYQVIDFRSEQAFLSACDNARELTALFPRRSVGFTPHRNPLPTGLSVLPLHLNQTKTEIAQANPPSRPLRYCQRCKQTRQQKFLNNPDPNEGGQICHSCYNKAKAAQGGYCPRCKQTRQQKFYSNPDPNEGGQICHSCYNKAKAAQGGYCQRCKQTRQQQFLNNPDPNEGGQICNSCYNKAKAAQGGYCQRCKQTRQQKFLNNPDPNEGGQICHSCYNKAKAAQGGYCPRCKQTRQQKFYSNPDPNEGGQICHSCYNKAKAAQGGYCQRCKQTRQQQFYSNPDPNEGGQICHSCYNKAKAAQGGYCQRCKQTRQQQFYSNPDPNEGGQICHSCYQKARRSKQVRVANL